VKLSLDATPEELDTRGPDLVGALSRALAPHAPELADALSKALPPKERTLKHKALRDLHAKVKHRYAQQLERMNAEIAALLDGELRKAEATTPDYTTNLVELETAAYERAKADLMHRGYTAEDFDDGGVLYGLSTNQLRSRAQDVDEGGVGYGLPSGVKERNA
jgi:hypothetical protein